MKKFFTLALAIFAIASSANAQNKLMKVHQTNGTTIDYEVNKVESITYEDSPWVSLGYCLYGEDFLGSALYPKGGEGDEYCCDYYVEVQENSEQSGLYRLVNPYGPDVYPLASHTTYDTEKNYYIEINCSDPDGVYIDYQDTGMTWDYYGRFYVYSYAALFYKQGNSWEDIKAAGWCGTLKDGVITFGEATLLSQFPEYSSGYFYGNYNNRFLIDTTDKSDTGGSKGVTPKKSNGSSINLKNLLTADKVAELRKD